MIECDERVKKLGKIDAKWHNANWETREKWIEELERWMGEDRVSQVIEEFEKSKT